MDNSVCVQHLTEQNLFSVLPWWPISTCFLSSKAKHWANSIYCLKYMQNLGSLPSQRYVRCPQLGKSQLGPCWREQKNWLSSFGELTVPSARSLVSCALAADTSAIFFWSQLDVWGTGMFARMLSGVTAPGLLCML